MDTSAVLQYRRIVQTTRFDEDYAYAGELGAFCEENQTRFALWAPTACEVQLDLRLADKQVLAAMTRGEKRRLAFHGGRRLGWRNLPVSG